MNTKKFIKKTTKTMKKNPNAATAIMAVGALATIHTAIATVRCGHARIRYYRNSKTTTTNNTQATQAQAAAATNNNAQATQQTQA